METMFTLQNFALISVLLVMGVILLQDFRSRRFNSIVLLSLLVLTAALGAVVTMEYYCRVAGNLVGTTWCTFLGFAIRPFCMYGFVLLARKKMDRIGLLLLAPMFLSAILHASAFFFDFAPLGHLVFYYVPPTTGTELVYTRGPLNFTSHILAAIYLAIIVYLSIRKLGGKHRYDAASVLLCATLTAIAVLLEMVGWVMGALNIAIAISIVFYYLFLLKEENRRDALTDLFDRKSFYSDVERFDRFARGIVLVDMNGLKYLNDVEGHAAGDVALKTIARVLEELSDEKMYVYRMGGDEFLILILRENFDYPSIGPRIKQLLEKESLSASVGYALREEGTDSVEAMMKKADEAMYADKAAYYQKHPRADRRGK